MKLFDRFENKRDEEDWKRALRKISARLRIPVEEVEIQAKLKMKHIRPQRLPDLLTTPAERMNTFWNDKLPKVKRD